MSRSRPGEEGKGRERVRAVLLAIRKSARALGAEFLDALGSVSCRVGSPRWRESPAARLRRAREELGVFRRLDHAGSVIVRPESLPESEAWEARLELAHLWSTNRRVSDRGVVHLYFAGEEMDESPDLAETLDRAAGEIERILEETENR